MTSLDDDTVDDLIILMSLLAARYHIIRSPKLFPKAIRKRLIARLTTLIGKYKNPNVSFDEE